MALFSRSYDHFEFSGHFCMVTDLLGPSLYKVLQNNNYHPYPMRFIRPILSDVANESSLDRRF